MHAHQMDTLLDMKLTINCTVAEYKQPIINPRRACAVRVTVVGSVCVCVCVCLSVKQHLTYGASVRPENAVTYSAGNEGQKFCGVFSETAPLQRSCTSCIVYMAHRSSAISRNAANAHAYLDIKATW